MVMRNLTDCTDRVLLAFHRLRDDPGKVRAIRDAKPVHGIDGSVLLAGTVVTAAGLIVHAGRYLLSVPRECCFYDYRDFEIMWNQRG